MSEYSIANYVALYVVVLVIFTQYFRSQIIISSINKVLITTLGLNEDTHARDLLTRAEVIVRPILQRRNWTVHHLAEFMPRRSNLLGQNWNRGRKIEIRLRRGTKQSYTYDSLFLLVIACRFLEFECILGTLLHELVHIEISRHGNPFKKLLTEITDECEQLCLEDQLLITRITDCGEVLGGNSELMQQYSQRDLVLFAAETRLAIQKSDNCIVLD